MLAVVEYIDYAAQHTLEYNYMDHKKLKKGYYAVHNITFFDDGEQARIDFAGKRFIIIQLGKDYSDKESLQRKAKVDMLHKFLFMEKACYGFHFYTSNKYPLYYQSSELIRMEEMYDSWYRVLLFSAVTIDNEKRVRVDIFPDEHFILPKINNANISIENLEFWNQQRWMVEVKCVDGKPRAYFFGEF